MIYRFEVLTKDGKKFDGMFKSVEDVKAKVKADVGLSEIEFEVFKSGESPNNLDLDEWREAVEELGIVGARILDKKIAKFLVG